MFRFPVVGEQTYEELAVGRWTWGERSGESAETSRQHRLADLAIGQRQLECQSRANTADWRDKRWS